MVKRLYPKNKVYGAHQVSEVICHDDGRRLGHILDLREADLTFPLVLREPEKRGALTGMEVSAVHVDNHGGFCKIDFELWPRKDHPLETIRHASLFLPGRSGLLLAEMILVTMTGVELKQDDYIYGNVLKP